MIYDIVKSVTDSIRSKYDYEVEVLVDPDGHFDAIVYGADIMDGELFTAHKGDELPSDDQVECSKIYYEKYNTHKRLNDEIFARNEEFVSDVKQLSVDELFDLSKKYIAEFETNADLSDEEKKVGLEEFYLVHYFITKYLENKSYMTESIEGHLLCEIKRRVLNECNGDHVSANTYVGELIGEDTKTLMALVESL